MKLTEIRIRNFRSIEAEQHFPIRGKMTLVGPNNSGKTNLLKAVRVFFTGFENAYGYKRETDLTFGAGRARTSITATFDGDVTLDKVIYDSIDELHSLQGSARTGTQLTLNLYFTDTNTPVYSFFPNVKRPEAGAQAAQYSRTHKILVSKLLDSFSLHYVPSVKSVDQIFEDLLMPFLRRKVSKVIEPHFTEIKNSLAEAASALNSELKAANLNGLEASFSLPSQSIDKLVSGFEFMIADPQETPIHEKGMGIQTTVLLAAFRWITKQEINEGRNVVWLLEEPESYLHPLLATKCNTILESLATDAIVLKTTHSMAFVPQDPAHISGVLINADSRTEVTNFRNFSEAVSSIRSALGIKFGDFYNLTKYNVFVEGETDREIFQWFINKSPIDIYKWDCLREASFEDFGGVKHLTGFLRATYQFIRMEQACVIVFDGDDAGDRERKELQQFFGQKDIHFEANKHFISVRSGFAIEGLFPDDWIKDIYNENSGWFETYSVDVSDQLQPFKVKDTRKRDLQEKLISRAESEAEFDWAKRFIQVCNILNASLEKQAIALTG